MNEHKAGEKIVKELRKINSMLTVGMPINAYDQMHIISRASNEIESLIKEIKEYEELTNE